MLSSSLIGCADTLEGTDLPITSMRSSGNICWNASVTERSLAGFSLPTAMIRGMTAIAGHGTVVSSLLNIRNKIENYGTSQARPFGLIHVIHFT